MPFAGQPYHKIKFQFISHFFLHPLRIPAWSVFYCLLMTKLEFLCSLLDWCSWKTSLSASLKASFCRKPCFKVLARRYKVSILPSKFRESSSRDSSLTEFQRWEKCEQILEFIMDEKAMCLTSIFLFLFETNLKKSLINEENFKNTGATVNKYSPKKSTPQ